MATEPLACPSCAQTYPLAERFCPGCRMPLVHVGSVGPSAAVGDRRQRARKIKPQYVDGPLVQVAGGRNQAEAEFIQALLLEEGVPSLLRRSRGFDVPDYLAAGPRDVMVPASADTAAREVLLKSELGPAEPPAPASPLRLALVLAAGVLLTAAVVWLVFDAAA